MSPDVDAHLACEGPRGSAAFLHRLGWGRAYLKGMLELDGEEAARFNAIYVSHNADSNEVDLPDPTREADAP